MDSSSYIIQDLLSDDVLTNHYKTLGYAEEYLPQYIRIYHVRYKKAIEKEVINASDFALYCANNFMPWYDFYLRLGHSQLWADAAGKFAADTLRPMRVTYENDPEILRLTFKKCYRVAKDAAIPELKMHCAKIAQGWGKGVPYGKKYAEMILSGADCTKAAKESDRYNRFCKRARTAGMSETTIWYFADLASGTTINPDHAWKLAQIRDELLNQGYDGDDLDDRMEDFRKEITSKSGRRKKKNRQPQQPQQYQQYQQGPEGYGPQQVYSSQGYVQEQPPYQPSPLSQPQYPDQEVSADGYHSNPPQEENIW